MSELRKPCLTILLRKQGTQSAVKVELFKSELWPEHGATNQYRIRVKGKWFDGGKYFYKTTFMQILAKSIRI